MEPTPASHPDKGHVPQSTLPFNDTGSAKSAEPPTKYDPEEHLTPIGVLFHLFASNDQPLAIEKIEALPLEQQLSILNPNNIHNEETRNTLTLTLCEQLPELKDSADKMDRFTNILKLFYEEQYITSFLPFAQFTKRQILVSLFCFFMNRTRRKPEGEDDEKRLGKELESADKMWENFHEEIDAEGTEESLESLKEAFIYSIIDFNEYDYNQHLTPIGVLFRLFMANDPSLVIDGIETLPMEQQLCILNPNNIHNEETRNTLTLTLCEQLPDLKNSADKMDRFKNILKLFYEQQSIASILPFTRCTKQQITVSLFCFLMHRLRRNPEGEDDEKQFENEMKSADRMWKRVHGLIDNKETEEVLKKELIGFYNKITENGTKNISNEHEIDDGDFDIYKLFPLWYNYRALTHQHIITALEHENGALSQVLKSVAAEIDDIDNLDEEKWQKLILKKLRERKLTFSEIQYIEDIWKRSKKREWNRDEMPSLVDGVASSYESAVPTNEEHSQHTDLNVDWPDLTPNLVRDIYGTHKVFMFGSFKFLDYTLSDFKSDIERAEIGNEQVAAIFGKVICSDFVETDQKIKDLSLYPKWLIQDDLFQIMTMQFAVNLLVNELKRDEIGDGLTVHCIVIPHSVVSLYDHSVEFVFFNKEIDEYLKSKLSEDVFCIPMAKSLDCIEEIAGIIRELFQDAVGKGRDTVFVIVDRRGNEQRFYTETEVEGTIMEQLTSNHCIGFQYQVKAKTENDTKSVQSWLCFGDNQSIRFWPEHLVWFIPRLFLKNNLNEREYLKKIFGNDYRHGFRTRLDDPVFNRYYKILTGFDHESVNYYRSESIPQRMEYKEFWNQKLNKNTFMFLRSNGYDSDAIFADIAVVVGGDDSDSNIVAQIREHSQNEVAIRSTIHSLYDFAKKSKEHCTIDNALELWDCHFVKELIQNLRTFRSLSFVVDAGNVSEFDISATIQGLDHLVTVHNMFSIKNRRRIRAFISGQIQCDLERECSAFLHQCSRRGENTENDQASRKESASDAVNSLCCLLMNNLSAAHCYLLHSDDILYRRSGESAKFEVNPFSTTVWQNVNTQKKGGVNEVIRAPMSIDWGKHILQWLPFGVHPRFATFLEEMLRNPESTLNQELTALCEAECAVKMKEAETRGIVFTKDELMCLKLYSDTNGLCAAFRRAHWIRTPLDIKRNFYNWGITMYRTFLFHSVPTIELTLYHGLNQMFMVENLSPLYNGPFSTTSAWSVAHSFSKGNGLLFTVGVQLVNPLKMVTGIDMKSISCHPNEHEVLLYSQIIPIQKTKVFESGDEPLFDHLMFSLKEMKDPITNKMDFYTKIGAKFKKKWIDFVMNHRLFLFESKYDRRIVAHRLQHELDVLGDRFTVKYEVQQTTAYLVMRSMVGLRINNPLRVHVSDSFAVKRGVVDIECADDLRIESKGAIDTNPRSGYTPKQANGGIIKLTSSGVITNDAILCCNGSLGSDCVGGTAYICCRGAFMNKIDGRIQCGKNGRIFIGCSDFENTGYISSEPLILINSANGSFVIQQLQCVHFCREHISVFDGSAIKLHRKKKIISNFKISDFVFAVFVDHSDSGKEYTFDDIESFQIPMDSPFLDRNGHFVTMWIYAKPKDGSFEYVPCQLVLYKDSFSRYTLEWNKPLLIDAKLRVIPSASSQQREDFVGIRCTENIVIGTNGVIETQRKSEDDNHKMTGNIILKTACHFSNHGILRNLGSVGGGIVLFAVDGVRNDGIMECSMLRGNDGGGTIVIMTNGEFVNNIDGQIKCGKNGHVFIGCSEFENTGYISSEPLILIYSITDSCAIEQLQCLYFCREHIFVFDGSAITVHQKKKTIFHLKMCDFVFAIFDDHSDSGKEYTFDDIESFQIPMDSPFLDRNGHFVTMWICAKPNDGSFEYIPCQVVKWKDSVSRYKLERNEPLLIDDKLRVIPSKSSEQREDIVSIRCTENIVIGTNGVIETQRNSEDDKHKMTGNIMLKTDAFFSNHGILRSIGLFGGGIVLFAADGARNNGIVECSMSRDDGSGGTIGIVTNGEFVNSIDGQIQCGKNDRIFIGCSEFENTGRISSEPLILINSVTNSFATEQLQCLYFYNEHIFFFDGSAIKMHQKNDIVSNLKISDFEFAVFVDHSDSEKEYTFENNEEFRIPIDSSFLNRNGHFTTTWIYLKPKDGSFEYIPCQLVRGGNSFSRYTLKCNEPLLIDDKLRVIPSESSQQRGNIVSIRCTENIVIGTNGVTEIQRDSEDDNGKVTGYIILETACHFANHGILRNIGLFGGGIVLFAVDGVRNDGILIMECSMLRDNDSGGTIAVVTDGEFVNNGIIDCGDDGMVVIQCSEFMNNGSISLRLTVVIDEERTAKVMQQRMMSMDNEGKIKLTVRKHRGHFIDYHPQNLLKEGTGYWYSSDPKCGPPNEDWIVFEHDEESRFIPTTVIIRNENWSVGIKRIAIYGGNNIDDLEEWIEIDGIHNEGYAAWNTERQIFPIAREKGYIAYIQKFKFFKLRVLENHGGFWNAFYEFAILGLKLR